MSGQPVGSLVASVFELVASAFRRKASGDLPVAAWASGSAVSDASTATIRSVPFMGTLLCARIYLCVNHPRTLSDSGSPWCCLLYTSDAADERSSVDLGGRRII